MDERLSIAIHEALRGLSTLKSYLRHYIYDYPLDADARKRIQELEFKDQPPLFWVKDSLVHEPASSLGSRLEGAEDDVVKGFLLLYCVSSGIRLLKEKIIVNMYLRVAPLLIILRQESLQEVSVSMADL